MESPTALLSLIIGLPLFGFLLNGLSGLFLHGYREKKSLIGACVPIGLASAIKIEMSSNFRLINVKPS